MANGKARQLALPAVYMRGGTSKGLFLQLDDLPKFARQPGPRQDALLLRLLGSPDPFAGQIDGMGAATPSTSKVILVRRSEKAKHEIEYWFGAIGIDSAQVDWSANCGNLTSAVAPLAIDQGLIDAGADGMRTVRLWQANIGQSIHAHIQVRDGQVVELGDFVLDGVAFPSSEIVLEFLESPPGPDDAPMFPTGHLSEKVHVPGFGDLDITMINTGAPTAFVAAKDLGLSGTELRDDLAARMDAVNALRHIRAEAAVRIGAVSSRDAAESSPHVPRVAYVAPPRRYVTSDGRTIEPQSIDLLARILSIGKLHHAMTGTGAVALAVAAAVPETVVSRVLSGEAPKGSIRFGHPSGSLQAGAQVECIEGQWVATRRVVMSRSARVLMAGQVFYPPGF